ncbi:MAG: hypothetical protein KAI47_16395, partial [Deltaproteobacteria bacterium]|nr:hypothetical protein [Deltaproteobacteria bacterium]
MARSTSKALRKRRGGRASKVARDARAAADLGALTLPACRIERLLGRSRRVWTVDDLVDFYVREGLRSVSLKHVGADGFLKTLDFIPRDLQHLRDIITAGERADGSSLFSELGIRSGRSDILLRPRLDSAFVDPFAAEPTLAFLCGHVGADGLSLPESPDSIVRAASEALARESGIDLFALGEVEYFIGRRALTPDSFGDSDRGYHASSPIVFGETLRREAMILLGEIGVPIKYGHSEVGYIQASETEGVLWEQHEIELSLAPLAEAADAIVLTQWVLRNLAARHELLCSFDPMVRRGHPGSGLHIHFSPMIGGEHLGGYDEAGQLHEAARWMIGGFVQLGAALMAFGNRKEGSFWRLSQ